MISKIISLANNLEDESNTTVFSDLTSSVGSDVDAPIEFGQLLL